MVIKIDKLNQLIILKIKLDNNTVISKKVIH
ncbi:hypothetical protein B0I10_11274 [Flavobacterium lacus]|uniref:Uncharacterized protein n=1 Tax=Flavobacterium lacus TaxID=1353778 RepID=A0A328WW27_9FLAO|nr:hypothetical protein B0I10_11274 [Flavobacterium lacus]